MPFQHSRKPGPVTLSPDEELWQEEGGSGDCHLWPGSLGQMVPAMLSDSAHVKLVPEESYLMDLPLLVKFEDNLGFLVPSKLALQVGLQGKN